MPSAIPVMMDIPKISLILLLKKNTAHKIAIMAANKISKAPILDIKKVMPVKAKVTPRATKQNLTTSCLL